jgi:hypothetical protein
MSAGRSLRASALRVLTKTLICSEVRCNNYIYYTHSECCEVTHTRALILSHTHSLSHSLTHSLSHTHNNQLTKILVYSKVPVT